MNPFKALLAAPVFALILGSAQAETIRVAIGTQDTTINCATGGILIRELKLLEKYLPHDGKYRDAKYEIVWKNFTSGPPLTNEMVGDKLDIGSMADFPGALNAAAFKKAGQRSFFITSLSGSPQGSGNGLVVPIDSPAYSLQDLKGKSISVPFGSTAHSMILRALTSAGLDPQRDVNLVSQSPEVGGSALQSNKIDAHADFVPFAELFPYRGFARKIYDGSQANSPTFHGTLVNEAYAKQYPEVVVAFLRAAIEADRLLRAEPEKYSELIAKVTGIEAEVNYLFHGPLGLQKRDFTFKPEYRAAIATAIETLALLKRTDVPLSADELVDDSYLRQAFKLSGLDYDQALKSYDKEPLTAQDERSGKPVTDFKRVAQVWVVGEPHVRHYASAGEAAAVVRDLEKTGKKIRVVFVHDRASGLKLLAKLAWFTRAPDGRIDAWLEKAAAEKAAKQDGGALASYAEAFGAPSPQQAAR
ncbi:MAG: ABC transporter substrate-binding protein [Azoarcus sp.]|jgi:NitT/TauT family transport system substrate-binding protein|nr:ABC transporter substrate-binding protein [Azoarcus sp.]